MKHETLYIASGGIPGRESVEVRFRARGKPAAESAAIDLIAREFPSSDPDNTGKDPEDRVLIESLSRVRSPRRPGRKSKSKGCLPRRP